MKLNYKQTKIVSRKHCIGNTGADVFQMPCHCQYVYSVKQPTSLGTYEILKEAF
jgi:hypothetical protein